MALATPCFGATLKGTVSNNDGMAIPKARVMVVHDMALLLAQRRNTDFNGRYHFDLDPGPYRIFVLKRGFRPAVIKLLIVDEQEEINLDHFLATESEATASRTDDRAKRLKEVFRGSNLHPLRSEGIPRYVRANQITSEPAGFAGSVQTGSRRDLDGSLERVNTVALETRLNKVLSLKSSLSTEAGGQGVDTTQITAEMAMQTTRLDLGLEAESIRGSRVEEGYSHRAALSGSYGIQALEMNTGVQIVATRIAEDDQRQMSVDQSLQYKLGGHQLSHRASVAEWRNQDTSFARRTSLQTDWQHKALPWLGVVSEVDSLALESGDAESSRLWVRGANDGKSKFRIMSNFGYHHDGEDDALVQQHSVGSTFGLVSLQVDYQDEQDYRPMSSGDVFGSYLRSPIAPHANESFFANHSRSVGLDIGVSHGSGWISHVNWVHLEEHGELLFAHQNQLFRDAAAHEKNRVDYALHSQPFSASLVLSYSENEAEIASFQQQSITYRQTLYPFRNKGMGLHLELSMQNNPNVPAWWLLEELPWMMDGSDNWYEGHVAFQF